MDKWFDSTGIMDFVRDYYDKRRYKMPNTDQAYRFMVTEVGEVADALNMLERGWVRNNPANHPTANFDKVAEELGDVIMMCMVTGLTFGHNPLTSMFLKMDRKLNEQGASSEESKGGDAVRRLA